MPTDDELVSFFLRHLVPVLFTFQRGADSQSIVVTAFVLSVANQWFLITAGHCIHDIEERTTEHGYQITGCYMIDSLGVGAKHREPIPFVYRDSSPTYLSEDQDFDYGVMVLSPYYQQLLEKNNIQALNEEAWKKQPAKVDFYWLLGIPEELTRVNPENIEITPTLHKVEPLSERPDKFPATDVPLFYGRIGLGEGVTTIKGMSGGPIFAFHKNEKGQLKYWLTALQSRWLPESHIIAAYPTKLLGDFLEQIGYQESQ